MIDESISGRHSSSALTQQGKLLVACESTHSGSRLDVGCIVGSTFVSRHGLLAIRCRLRISSRFCLLQSPEEEHTGKSLAGQQVMDFGC